SSARTIAASQKYEARFARGPARLRFSAAHRRARGGRPAPLPDASWCSRTGQRSLRTGPAQAGCGPTASGPARAAVSAAPSSAASGSAREARFVLLTCGALFERSSRSERSELRRTSPRSSSAGESVRSTDRRRDRRARRARCRWAATGLRRPRAPHIANPWLALLLPDPAFLAAQQVLDVAGVPPDQQYAHDRHGCGDRIRTEQEQVPQWREHRGNQRGQQRVAEEERDQQPGDQRAEAEQRMQREQHAGRGRDALAALEAMEHREEVADEGRQRDQCDGAVAETEADRKSVV